MRRKMLWLIVWIPIVCGLAPGTDGEELRLAVAVKNQAGLEGAAVRKSEEIAARIFRGLSVRVEWHNASGSGVVASSSDARARGADLLVNLARVDSTAMGSEATGLALLPEPGSMGYLIYVFEPKIERLVDKYWLRLGGGPGLRPVLLGHVIAHEMEHQLLSSAQHSGSGIMKAAWDRKDIQLAYEGRLQFSPQQSGKIREAVRTRNALPYRACLVCRD